MEVVKSFKTKFNSESNKKLSEYFGEGEENVKKALELGLGIFTQGLVDIAKKEGDAKLILKVIKDGGHSGDLIDDLTGLFGKRGKLQLLIKIGENINGHFFKTDARKFVGEIASKNWVNYTSSASIMNLSAPLVLGFMGKEIKQNGWELSAFTKALLKEGRITEIEEEEPQRHFFVSPEDRVDIFKEERPIRSSEKEKISRPKTKSRKSTVRENGPNWLAWVLLVLLGAGAVYYSFQDDLSEEEALAAVINNSDDSLVEENDDIFDVLGDGEVSQSGDSSAQNFEKEPKSVFEANTIFENEEFKNRSKENKTLKPSRKTDTPSRSGTKTQAEPAEIQKSNPKSEIIRTVDNVPMAEKLNVYGVFFGINNFAFKQNSAEVADQGELSKLINFLRINSNRIIEIAAQGETKQRAKDRAYALRELLFSKGISLSRIKIIEANVRSSNPVEVRIK